MPFKKGQSGNAKGRPKGSPDAATPGVKALALSIVTSKDYLARVESQAKEGTLHPKIESMLWAYAYGAPTKDDSQGKTGLTVNLGFLQLPEPQEQPKLAKAIEVKALTNGHE